MRCYFVFFALIFPMLSGAVPVVAQTVSRGTENLQLSCSGSKIFFDGACRGYRFFRNLVPHRAELLEVTGCQIRSADPKICGGSAVLTEKAQIGRIRTLTILIPEAWAKGNSGREAPLNLTQGTPSRGEYPVALRSVVSITPKSNGRLVYEQVTEGFAPGQLPQLLVEQTLEFERSESQIRNPTFDVSGEICVGNPHDFTSGSGDRGNCTCIDEGICGLGVIENGSSLSCVGETCRMCAQSSAYSANETGVVKTEIELLLTRAGARVPGLSRSLQPVVAVPGSNCWRAEGHSFAGLLATTSEGASGFSSSCGPDVQSGVQTANALCRTAAIHQRLPGEMSRLFEYTGGITVGEQVSMTNPFGISGSGNIGVVGIDGQGLSQANLESVQAELTSQLDAPGGVADQACGHMSSGIASVEYMAYFCEDGIGNSTCDGTHSNVPVTVTAENGAKCNAVAELECVGATESTTLLSPECNCVMLNAQVDESSCR